MPDKDQFTFEDDKAFSEPDLDNQNNSQELGLGDSDEFAGDDLSSAFSEGEYAAEAQTPDDSESQGERGGSSRMRMLLLVLLVVVAGAAGAYYFVDLGGTTPSVPTVPVPVQNTSKSVALPPPPAMAPVVQETPMTPAKTEPVATPVTVAVPAPPAETTAGEAPVKEAPVEQTVVANNTPAAPVVNPVEKVAVTIATSESANPPATQAVTTLAEPAPAPQTNAETTKAVTSPVPASQKVAATVLPASKLTESAESVEIPKQVVRGTYVLDAGSYLFKSNLDTLVAKARKLGYEPLVTPVDATLDMTRLRLGTFGKDEVQEALALARTIEPGSYRAPAGDRYVVYAGTFLQRRNIEQLSQRFIAEGFKVRPEPVQVVRTLSRIRFGSFTTEEEAVIAAQKAIDAGLQAEVVKNK